MTVLVAPVRYTPHIGGIETLLVHTMPTLRALGHEFVVVTGTDDDATTEEVVDGVPVYRFPFQHILQSSDPARMLAASAGLRRIETEHDVHLRHVHGLDFAIWFVLRRHRSTPLPLLVSVHGTLDAPHPYSPLTTQTLVAADVVTAVSASVRSSLETTVPELAGRVRVIRNGLTVDQVPRADAEAGRVLVAGRFDWLKGFDLAIQAMASLRDARPEARLHLAGTGREDRRLRELARDAGVADRVVFLGGCTHDEVLDEVARASVVVVPSRAIEGFSLIALEAAHLGRPVIASNVGGLPETVVDGVTGVLVPPDDVQALATALDDLLGAPARAAQLGAAAQRLAGRFDATHCAQEYAALYDAFAPPPALLAASPTGSA